jgi:serine/threonine protein kinase
MQEFPDKIGRYEISEEIGRGSMGVVYHAYDPLSDEQVAIKVAKQEVMTDMHHGATFQKLFYNEARLAGKLTHPNILGVYDATLEEDDAFIVMELVPGGGTLEPYCKPDNLLPIENVVEIIFKAAKALDYAHRQGVVHRDIKPSNILATSDMDVKIGDFSISYITRADVTETQITGLIGSPQYMSPEQLREEAVTAQTDIFSLGLVMYELLTGKHPFTAKKFSLIMNKILNEEAQHIKDLRSDVPDVLVNIVERALNKDPEKRYKHAIDLAADLSIASDQLLEPPLKQETSREERFALIEALDFFNGFPSNEIWEIINASTWEDFDDNEPIITEGDIDDSFYILVEGDVVVRKGPAVIGMLTKGDCFGEMGYLSKTKRTASIFSKGHVSLLKAKFTLMEQVSESCQLRFTKVFLRTLVHRLSKANARISSDSGKTS